MIDREKVLTVLRKRFPGAEVQQVAAAANAIVGLDEEWEEVTDEIERHADLRVFKKRELERRPV